MRFLKLNEVLYLHQQLLKQSGGTEGIRDLGALESAIAQPQMTFDGVDLYPTLIDKTAALGFSLINNHPFVDGNKRVGFESMRLMLRMNGYDIHASQSDKYSFVMDIAEGNMGEQEIADWIKTNSTKQR